MGGVGGSGVGGEWCRRVGGLVISLIMSSGR